MSNIITRSPYADELPDLQNIWQAVFGPDGQKSFFDYLYQPEHTIIAEQGGKPAAMGYLIPAGDLLCKANAYPCAMLYAIATLPQHRNKGLGAAVVNKLISAAFEAGYKAAVLSPSDDSLFDYYSSRTPMRGWFYCHQERIDARQIKSNKKYTLKEVSPARYDSLREAILEGSIHIRQGMGCLEYQKLLCDELGGGMFQIGDSCAAAEIVSDQVLCVKELLISGSDNRADIIAAIAGRFPMREFICRYPAKTGQGRRSGMIAMSDGCGIIDISAEIYAPLYGMAFD